jgi:hypothetical protein
MTTSKAKSKYTNKNINLSYLIIVFISSVNINTFKTRGITILLN